MRGALRRVTASGGVGGGALRGWSGGEANVGLRLGLLRCCQPNVLAGSWQGEGAPVGAAVGRSPGGKGFGLQGAHRSEVARLARANVECGLHIDDNRWIEELAAAVTCRE